MNDFFVGVPFSGVDERTNLGIISTREDEALAIAAGAKICGRNPLVYMQNSGLGNSIDVITSLLIPYGLEVDLLISNRKEPEHHKVMGDLTEKIIGLLDYGNKVEYC